MRSKARFFLSSSSEDFFLADAFRLLAEYCLSVDSNSRSKYCISLKRLASAR